MLNLVFDAAGGDGVDQPKLSAITVLGIEDPIVECELPEEWDELRYWGGGGRRGDVL